MIAEGPLDANVPEFVTRGAAMESRDLDLMDALRHAGSAFFKLANHAAFAGDAPEFNDGGVGREAYRIIKTVLDKYKED